MPETRDTRVTLAMMRKSLYSAVVCDALDALGYDRQSPRLSFTAYTTDQVLVGRCKTTFWGEIAHEDDHPYEKELSAIDSCQIDDVLIAAAQGSMSSGIWGELLSTAAMNRGCVGAIIDGAVRDVRKMKAMGFPIFARATSIYDSKHRQRVVDFDVPVEIDGVRFSPGDLVFADIDGVVVVPQQIEAELIQCAWQKVHAENFVRDAIKSGMKASDAYNKYGVL